MVRQLQSSFLWRKQAGKPQHRTKTQRNHLKLCPGPRKYLCYILVVFAAIVSNGIQTVGLVASFDDAFKLFEFYRKTFQ